ncbi:MAG: type II secretion system protein [Rhodoferax sp.]|uniref:type II secretion system protein n=1 Tax=Rhodoferax sp. TaxID=50421 RepID=UPI00140185BA|nr:type II secretion system protein [Rhodoferax sp.]NDP40910.1 type II secretion system protein [Rhodoferax sp.]
MKIPPTRSAARPWTACTGARQRGFTLIELIMVMVMLGLLAVFAAPRLFSASDVYARGFHDETLAYLRYAQKAAIAQRRMVCATFDTTSTPNTLALTMENPPNAPAAVVCNVNLTGPKGESPARIAARSGVAYSSATSLIFNGLGQPVSSARAALTTSTTIKIATVSNTIMVEAATGYVHD